MWQTLTVKIVTIHDDNFAIEHMILFHRDGKTPQQRISYVSFVFGKFVSFFAVFNWFFFYFFFFE